MSAVTFEPTRLYREVFTVEFDKSASEPASNRCHCTIIPPHIEEHLKQHSDESIKKRAVKNHAKTTVLREVRAGSSKKESPAAVKQKYKIYDAKNNEVLPGQSVKLKSLSSGGALEATEAYQGAVKVYDFFKANYGRSSVDGKGLPLKSTVHYGKKYNNAFWNREQMVYGDGDGKIFTRFTIALDVIAHELTHGVTDYTAGLVYQDQPGALNESVSDVFGSLARQCSLKQTADKADWLIGDQLLIGPGALRSLKEPGRAYVDNPYLGTDPQPAKMSAYNPMKEDNGGVHINSGIPNHAFYLAATKVGGFAWEKVGRVWYNTLLECSATASFAQFAGLTVTVSARLYGKDDAVTQAILGGWTTVEVNPT